MVDSEKLAERGHRKYGNLELKWLRHGQPVETDKRVGDVHDRIDGDDTSPKLCNSKRPMADVARGAVGAIAPGCPKIRFNENILKRSILFYKFWPASAFTT